jgi:uncharacterized protein YjgD (DUF1641 family)
MFIRTRNKMANPIPLTLPRTDPRIELQARLENAPAAHAEALLAAYEVLQGLHDRGILDLMRGGLGSGDKVLDIAVTAAQSPTSIRGLRNLLLLVNMLGEMEPELLGKFTEAIPQALQLMVHQPERPGMWTLTKDFLWNQDFRHGLAALNTLLEVLGKSIHPNSTPLDASPKP